MSSASDYPKWQIQITKLANHFELDVIDAQRVFNRYKDLVNNNSAINTTGAHFHKRFERNHYYTVLAAIRKVGFATDKNEFSLLKIVQELIGSGGVVTRQNYPGLIGLLDEGAVSRALIESASVGYFEPGGKLNTDALRKDEQALVGMRDKLKFVNERVLHLQKNPAAAIAPEGDLEDIIEQLKVMIRKYRLFLTGHDIEWSIEVPSWVTIFTQPWVVGE
ncbi:MAG TPA: hypothetical protein VIR03_00795 [Candidatus Saccharimonadales bacterium]